MSRTKVTLFAAGIFGVAAAVGWIPHRWVASDGAPAGVAWQAWGWGLSGPRHAGGPVDLRVPLPDAQGGARELRLSLTLDARGAAPRGAWDAHAVAGLAQALTAQPGAGWKDAAATWFAQHAPAFGVDGVWWRPRPGVSWRDGEDEAASARGPGAGRRVVVLGLDGLEPRILDAGIRAGRLPTFARILGEGASGVAAAPRPVISPILWTSMATGAEPEQHGILDFYVMENGVRAPCGSAHRKAPAFWNAAEACGRPATLHGWWATHPLEGDVAQGLSDKALGPLYLAPGAPAQGGVNGYAPEALNQAFAHANDRLAQDGLPAHSGDKPADFSDRDAGLGAAYSSAAWNFELLRRSLASAAPGQVLVHYVEGTDLVGHLTMAFRAPALDSAAPADVKRWGGEVDRYYAWVDRQIASVLPMMGTGDLLLVLSDHGFRCADDRPETGGDSVFGSQAELWHTDHATWYAWSADRELVRAHWRPLENATVRDAADTVLAMAGFPHGERSWWDETPTDAGAWARYRARWERPSASGNAATDEAALEALRTLGYVDAGGTAAGGTSATETALINEGILAMERDDDARAEDLFRQALAKNPRSATARHNLCSIALKTRRFPEAVAHFLEERSLDGADNAAAWTDFVLLLHNEQRPAEILRVVDAGRRKHPQAYELLQTAGTSLGELGQCGDALPLFEAALALRPDAVSSLNNAGLCASQLGRRSDAVRYFDRSLAVDPGQNEVRSARDQAAAGR